MTRPPKKDVKYWFFLTAGIVLNSMQIYKYFTNTFTFEWPVETAVLFIGSILIVKPTALPDIILKVTGKK